MIQLIVGDKGSGKTKKLIDMMNESAETLTGSMVCIEKGMKSTYNIKSSIRIIDTDDYAIKGYTMFYGFFMGVLAGDYDIEEVYVDGILRIGENDLDGLVQLLDKIEEIAKDNLIITITVSSEETALPQGIKKFAMV